MLTLCACGSGRIGSVSRGTDPSDYFVNHADWALEELKDLFGEATASQSDWMGIVYENKTADIFGETWSETIAERNMGFGFPPEIINVYFTFGQGEIQDKDWKKYLDEIISYYTSVFGYPESYEQDSNLPYWVWDKDGTQIIIQDCLAADKASSLIFSNSRKAISIIKEG